jgi:7,8-dihydropterin-6-yl-methyl-4-(beta-D-ribofuranosyl)aminobenzene 5'-phosphate synthase
MKNIRFFAALLLLSSISCRFSGQVYETLPDHKGINTVTDESGISSPVTVKVIYDNFVFLQGTTADWGYSIVVEGLDKVILFDTGTRPEIFESNIKKTKTDLSGIDLLVISHEHGDHTGGIPYFVKMKTGIQVIIPHSFSESFKKEMTGFGLTPVLAEGPSELCKHLYTSGEFEHRIAEQALVLDTKNGLVVMTGCSHPGIVEMLKTIKADFGKNICMVFGGFHLMNKSQEEMETIISEMKSIGLEKCGASHCTGEKQIEMFRMAFGDNYMALGTGNEIIIE